MTNLLRGHLLDSDLIYGDETTVQVLNHTSGSTQPSQADEQLTTTLKTALALIDIRVPDHLLIAGCSVLSLTEMGLV